MRLATSSHKASALFRGPLPLSESTALPSDGNLSTRSSNGGLHPSYESANVRESMNYKIWRMSGTAFQPKGKARMELLDHYETREIGMNLLRQGSPLQRRIVGRRCNFAEGLSYDLLRRFRLVQRHRHHVDINRQNEMLAARRIHVAG